MEEEQEEVAARGTRSRTAERRRARERRGGSYGTKKKEEKRGRRRTTTQGIWSNGWMTLVKRSLLHRTVQLYRMFLRELGNLAPIRGIMELGAR